MVGAGVLWGPVGGGVMSPLLLPGLKCDTSALAVLAVPPMCGSYIGEPWHREGAYRQECGPRAWQCLNEQLWQLDPVNTE